MSQYSHAVWTEGNYIALIHIELFYQNTTMLFSGTVMILVVLIDTFLAQLTS